MYILLVVPRPSPHMQRNNVARGGEGIVCYVARAGEGLGTSYYQAIPTISLVPSRSTHSRDLAGKRVWYLLKLFLVLLPQNGAFGADQ